jgi:hypothetical protein
MKNKNIWLLPTKKMSRLYLRNGVLKMDNSGFNLQLSYQNIYITSDEEIKEDDVVYSKRGFIGKFGKFENSYIDECKKIIITTDHELIADGVQAIDDEFLEWFVKNPSCEFVEVEKKSYIEIKEISYEGDFQNVEYVNYKIIIPKEEPKQDLEKAIFNLEEELDIPSHLRLHNSKTEQEKMYSEEEVDKLLDTLLHNNMCSVAGDELIKQFKKK